MTLGLESTHLLSDDRFLCNRSFGEKGIGVSGPGLTLGLKACMVVCSLYQEHVSLKSEVCDGFCLGSELGGRGLEE